MIKEKFDLTGKNALVVGGRGFLGRRFCAALAEFGAKVYSADLPQPSLAAARDDSAIAGGKISAGIRTARGAVLEEPFGSKR